MTQASSDRLDLLPTARTDAEARAYARLHGCGCAGEQSVRSTVGYVGDDRAQQLTTRCVECGSQSVFRFALTELEVRPVGQPHDMFGFEHGPSLLIGIDEWVTLADAAALLGTPESLRVAVAALQEACCAIERSDNPDTLRLGRLRARQRAYER